jgi:hypothetical protein
MIRIFYVVLISILLSGCPATFNGLIKNESIHEILVVPPFETEFSWVIEPGSQEKINWYQECIIIKGPGGIQYFSGWPIPDNVVSNGIFSSSFKTVYTSNQLYFITHDGQLIKINQVPTCITAHK